MSTRSPEARAQLRDLAANPARGYKSCPVSEPGLGEWLVVEEATAAEVLEGSAYLIPTESMLKYVEVLVRDAIDIEDHNALLPRPDQVRDINFAYIDSRGDCSIGALLPIASVTIEYRKCINSRDDSQEPSEAGYGDAHLSIRMPIQVFNSIFNSINRFLHGEVIKTWTDVPLDSNLTDSKTPKMFQLPNGIQKQGDCYSFLAMLPQSEAHQEQVEQVAGYLRTLECNLIRDLCFTCKLQKVFNRWTDSRAWQVVFTFATEGEELVPDTKPFKNIAGRGYVAFQEMYPEALRTRPKTDQMTSRSTPSQDLWDLYGFAE